MNDRITSVGMFYLITLFKIALYRNASKNCIKFEP